MIAASFAALAAWPASGGVRRGARLRDVNLAIEKSAWKAFRTEFYPTYDYYPIVRDKLGNKSRLAL